MADATYYEGDRRPYMRATLSRGGAAIDLTSANGVSFKMHRRGRATLAPAVSAAGVIITAADGLVEYQWQAGDLDLYGNFEGVFVIDWGASVPEGVPDTDPIAIEVRPSAT